MILKNKLKIVLLTTNTSHHIYFARKFSEQYNLSHIIIESKKIKFNYDTSHLFEKKIDDYEKKYFQNKKITFNKIAPSTKCYDINSSKTLNILKNIKPNIIFVYGTRKINQDMIKKFNGKIFNFHGGNPNKYRGLDSLLWSLYYRDFSNILVTLHFLEKGLDTGDVIYKQKIKLKKTMRLNMLRSEVAEICIKLALKLINQIKKNGKISSYKNKKGQYYSAMPKFEKSIALINFNEYVKKL